MFSPRRRIQREPEAPQEFMDKYINPGENFVGGNERAKKWANQAAQNGTPLLVWGGSMSHNGDTLLEGGPTMKSPKPSGTPEQLDDYTQYLLKTPAKNLQFHDSMNAINQRMGKQPQPGNNGFDRFFNLQRQAAADQGNQFVPSNDSDMRVVEHLQRSGGDRYVRPLDTRNGDPDAMPPMQRSPFANQDLPLAEEDFLFQPGRPAPNFAPATMPAGGDGGMVPNYDGGWIDELQARVPQMDMSEPSPFANQPAPQPAQMPPSNPPMDDALRRLLMSRMTGHEEMANRNLNYWDEDLTRRSRRDVADDFWSNVGAPIAGGMGSMMKQNTAGLGEMAAGWQDQAASRRGERMNLVNMLSGRQNKAMDYMMATDPSVIKNQMGLINALANRQRAEAYGQGVDNSYNLGQQKLKFTQMDAETRRANMESMKGLHDAQIQDLANKGLIDRDLANSTIAFRQAQAGHMQRQDDQAAIDETGRNTRFAQGEAGEDRRLGVRESGMDRRQQVSEAGDDRRQQVSESGMNSRNAANNESRTRNMQYEQEQTNQRYAAGMDGKGKSKTSDDFRGLMGIPQQDRAQYQAAMRKWNSLSPQEQNENRKGYGEFMRRKFGVDI